MADPPISGRSVMAVATIAAGLGLAALNRAHLVEAAAWLLHCRLQATVVYAILSTAALVVLLWRKRREQTQPAEFGSPTLDRIGGRYLSASGHLAGVAAMFYCCLTVLNFVNFQSAGAQGFEAGERIALTVTFTVLTVSTVGDCARLVLRAIRKSVAVVG